MAKFKRVASVVFAGLFVFVMMFSLFVIASEADHDCSGADCPICEMIAVCRNILKTLSGAVVALAALFSAFCAVMRLVPLCKNGAGTETPISLKVKLLD